MRKEARVERAGERDRGARESGGNHRNCTAALKGEEGREERRGKPEADGLAEESSRGTMEPNPTAVRTYYRKWNNGELGALPRLLSPLSPCRTELEELPSLQM